MAFTLGDIAAELNAELSGDASIPISGVAALDDAVAGEITFVTDARYAEALKTTRASAAVVAADFNGEHRCALLKVQNPDAGFARACDLIGPANPCLAKGIHERAVVARDAHVDPSASLGACCVVESGARIGANVEIWPGSYVGHDSVIGADSKLYPNVTVRERVTIGERVILHSGCVVGSDGFGYVNMKGEWKKIRQVGVVIVGDDVEVGACVTIDRARFGKTVIGRGTKLDNLVQIAHNVELGENCAFAAQVGIAGSAKIGRNVQMGGQSGSAGHLTIGDYSVVAARGGVIKDIPPKSFVSGFPAVPHNEMRRMHAHMARLPELKEKVRDLEKRLEQLESGRSE